MLCKQLNREGKSCTINKKIKEGLKAMSISFPKTEGQHLILILELFSITVLHDTLLFIGEKKILANVTPLFISHILFYIRMYSSKSMNLFTLCALNSFVCNLELDIAFVFFDELA